MSDNLLAALPLSVVVMLSYLYIRGMYRAYRAAGDDWGRMDRDVRVVFLFAVPVFRGAVRLLMMADRIFYRPKTQRQFPAGTYRLPARSLVKEYKNENPYRR